MKFSLKTAVAASALALASTSVLAQSVPAGPVAGPPPLPSTGSSGLVLAVWDTTQPISLAMYLGLNYADVLPTTNMTSESGLFLDFGTVNGFASTFAGSTTSNLQYNIFAIDGSGAVELNGTVTTAALGLVDPFATTGTQTTLQSTAANFFGQIANTCGTTNPCISNASNPGPYAGDDLTWGSQYRGTLAFDASGEVGTALGFYYIDPVSRSGTAVANVTAFGNSQNLGQWLLSSTGQLTYSLAPAAVPLPAAAWLLLSALGGLGAVSRRRAVAAV